MAETVLSRVLTFVQNNDLVAFHAFMRESNMSPNGFLPSGEHLASLVMFKERPLLCTYLFNRDDFDPHSAAAAAAARAGAGMSTAPTQSTALPKRLSLPVPVAMECYTSIPFHGGMQALKRHTP
jgi:hypothetical protein